MVGDRYEVSDDPACYPGTSVLINLLDLRDESELRDQEAELTARRSNEPLPDGNFDPAHYRAVHHHLFQDVYPWAGKYRTIRTHKGKATFCYPELILGQMNELFKHLKEAPYLRGSDPDEFIRAVAWFLGELNAIHPFREGNGRTQLAFVRLLGLRADHPFRSESIEAEPFLDAMIESFRNGLDPLIDELERMRA